MKLPATCLLVFTLIFCVGQAKAQISPILHYSFDDPVNPGHDDTGNGNDLTIPGPWSSIPGAIGNGIHFDYHGVGTNYGSTPLAPYISTSGLNYPGPNGFSVEYQVQVGSAPVSTRVCDYWQHKAGGEVFSLVYSDLSGKAEFHVRHDFGSPTIIEASIQKSQEEWVHLLGVYEPEDYKIRLFVDGVPVDEATMPGPMRTSIPPYLYVSGSWHATETATVDEVKIYDVAIPEPATLSLLALGSLVLVRRKRKIMGQI